MNKGFTLVELLAVIVILGIIALITIPAIDKTIKDSKQKMYDEQIKQIETTARNWGIKNTSLFNEYEAYYLSLDILKKEGYLEEKDIINPIDNKQMTGCIKIEYKTSTNQYDYSYNEACTD